MAAGLPAAFGRLHLDHVIPVAMGGANGPTQLVHERCNTQSGGLLGALVTNARNGHPVDQITEVRVLDPYFYTER